MIDFRPIAYIIGWLVAVLGASMIFPLFADIAAGDPNSSVFAASAILTLLCGVVVSVSCANTDRSKITVQQSFLLATGIWAVFPVFAAIPFWMGSPNASVTDAFFEAMSALTTTGATVFSGLDHLPPGVLLWRGMLQWFGGLGIIVVAMVFLPALKVGGMQIFKSEAFDTLGKILPRAGGIAMSMTMIYGLLTFLCFMAYIFAGMDPFEAIVHAMTTTSTGGMATTDQSFGKYGAAIHYIAVVFMLLAAFPFVRYIQVSRGAITPLMRDSQVRTFLAVNLLFCLVLVLYVSGRTGEALEPIFREALFNVVSIATGTGYASADYGLWGPLAVTMFFVLGLIGGCSGSTACSVKVFRYQLLFASVVAELKRLNSPNLVFTPRYDGRQISQEVMDSVMAFFMFFFLTLSVVAVLLVLMGLDTITAVSGAATAIANIGPGLGPEIGPAGNFAGLPDGAKWLLALTMLVGRLELMSVFVLFNGAFWRA